MKHIQAIAAIFSVILYLGCATHDIVSDINTSEVTVSGNDSLSQLVDLKERKFSTDNAVDSQVNAEETTKPLPEHNDKTDETTEENVDTFIPSIPQALAPKEILVDLDYTFALVNGDVITSKDIQKDLINYIEYLQDIRNNMSQSPFDLEGRGGYSTMLKEAELNALYRNFERKMLDILYKHKAGELKMYLGSVPEESIRSAINDSKRQHGIFGDDDAANDKWGEVLAVNNLSYLEFREQIINQLNQQRTLWLISNHPDFRIDITLDVTPRELREEYRRQPVSNVTNVELYRLEIPILPTNYDKILEKINVYRSEIENMLKDADMKDAKDKFIQHTKAVYPFWVPKREKLTQLNDEEPQIIYEINNAKQLPRLCSTIELSDKIVIIFLVNKKQEGLASFSSMLVQVELFRRLQNELWNEFRERFSNILIREATIIPGDLVTPK
ncbi:MAG: hypothetical protein K8S87_02285 [Planctomycetes bacterium]|nr:hypothetical protein [Planctomycetota bacterium]